MWDEVVKIATVVAVPISILAIIVGYIASQKPKWAEDNRRLVMDPASWGDILNTLRPTAPNRYFTAIARTSAWFDHVYGPQLLGWRAVDRSLTFAFVYAICTLFVGWVLFDAGRLGGVAFLPTGQTFAQRAGVAAALIFAFTLLEFSTRYRRGIIAWTKAKTQKLPAILAVLRGMKLTEELTLIILITSLSTGALYIAVIANEFAAVTTAGAAIVAINVGFRAGEALEAIKISIVSVILGMLAVLFLYVELQGDFPFFTLEIGSINNDVLVRTTTFLLFLIILPVLNALADFLSVAFTRWSLRLIVARRLSAACVVGGVVVDAVFAMGCLALLLWSITWVLDLWAAYGPIPLAFDWKDYRATLCGGDWQAGTMLWLMLITTLLPTALHLAMGFAAVFAHTRQVDAEIAAHLGPALAQWQNATSDTERKRAVDLALSSETRIQHLTGLLCRKDSRLRWVTAALFALFLALMIGAVLSLAHYMALPQLCPAA